MATFSDCSKSKVLMPESATLAAAELRTFSKTRGTPKMTFGRERANSIEMVEKSDQWFWEAPRMATAMDTARAKTCASGRKVKVWLPGTAKMPIGLVHRPRVWASQFRWVKIQPFGRPVVPEVYTREARSSVEVALMRA